MSQTAKDIISANIQTLIAQLNEGKSEALTAYLNAMSSFHSYSFGNIMQIARQRPDASRVAGFNAWKALGRNVKKGEKGIQILAPMIGKKKTETEGVGEENTKAIYGFRAVYVFDVTQTEGAELPAISSRVQGEVGAHLVQLRGFAESQAIAIEYAESIAPALGMSYGGKIAILPGQSEAEEFATLVHEIAHEMLHKGARRAETSKTMRETEAEAVSFIITRAIGLDTGSAACDYIQLYNGDAETLASSLEAIQKASHAILTAIQSAGMAETIAA